MSDTEKRCRWRALASLFHTDDGSLPDIFVENLTGDEVIAVYDYVLARSSAPKDTEFWSVEDDCAVPIAAIENSPARLVVYGQIQGFRHQLIGLTINGLKLPDLSIEVFPIEVSFDYRMGPAWGPPEVDALFEFLFEIRNRASNPRIYRADEGMSDRPSQTFTTELERYFVTRA